MKLKTIRRKGYSFGIVLTITAIFLILGSGCNSNTNKEAKGTDSTNNESKEPAQMTAGMTLTGDLYTVKLDSASYHTLSHLPGTVKLILQFYFNSDDSKTPGLIAYPSKRCNVFVHPTHTPPDPKDPITSVADTLNPDQPAIPIESKMVFGDNEITYHNLDTFIADNTSNGRYTFIVFTPRIDPDTKHVYYRITLEGTTQTLNGTLDTNPSPPKDASN